MEMLLYSTLYYNTELLSPRIQLKCFPLQKFLSRKSEHSSGVKLNCESKTHGHINMIRTRNKSAFEF